MTKRELEILEPIVNSFVKNQPLNVAHLTIAYTPIELEELRVACIRAMLSIEAGAKVEGMLEDVFGSKRYALKYLAYLETQTILINRATDKNNGRVLYGMPILDSEDELTYLYEN